MKQNLSLFIVEDDAFSLTILKGMLDVSGLQLEKVDHATTLSKAIESLSQTEYDAILLDLNLPDSRGDSTLDQIVKRFPELTIIVITGEADEAMGLQAISKGAQDYLLKGKYSIEDLSKSIRYSIGRKEAREEAKRSERIVKTLIDHLPQRILLKDLEFRYVFCNQNYARNFHLPVEEVLGKNDFDFYSEEIAHNNAANDQEVVQTAGTVEDVLRQEINGEECITRVLKTAVKNDNGRVEGVLCVYEDFTGRVKYEEAIQQANEELQNTNRQLKEMQSQLVQSEKLASIGQLASGVAHEINNPLGFVSSNFSTLEKYLGTITPLLTSYDAICGKFQNGQYDTLLKEIADITAIKEKEQVDFILDDIPGLFSDSREGIRRIIQIVKSLRDFSRIDQPEDFSIFNINQGIQATLVVAQNELKYAVIVKTQYGDIPEIFCNSGQLNQVFLNILVNAAQAIMEQHRRERGTISIRTYMTDDYVCCDIADDGPGIPEENLSKIYDPFFTTKPVGQGTGLGLNLSYDIIVNKHKGRLLVDSNVGQGTKFTIQIPRNLEEQLDLLQRKEEEHGNSTEDLVCR